ncbi:MAG: bifunctional metallophosphatase/5'-nucleotidase [Bacteroidetes bacterium]|nr:MAG: bifunctional metallophosphatase/5'-nucleotidase [Bacteroidota bacterium]
MNRRTFAKTSLIAGISLGAGLPLLAYGQEKISHLCILHTNDTHSRIDPYPANDPNYPNMGGYARRAAVISQIRQTTPHVLLLDAGDIFQGTPYFNVYGGEPELMLMTKMGYDAATMGNHEFDNGLDGFLEVLPHAGFPFVISNYDFSATILHGKTMPYKVMEKGDLKIGLYGLGIELEGLVGRNLYAETLYVDPVDVARRVERLLKEELGCDIIICLSHLGYEYETGKVSDVVIARKTRYTDIILGGHTHTLLDPPAKIENAAGKKVHIGQTGYAGVRLGRMDLYFNKKNSETFVESNTTNIFNNQA